MKEIWTKYVGKGKVNIDWSQYKRISHGKIQTKKFTEEEINLEMLCLKFPQIYSVKNFITFFIKREEN